MVFKFFCENCVYSKGGIAVQFIVGLILILVAVFYFLCGDFNAGTLLGSAIFGVVGIVFVVSAIRQKRRDKATEENGENCFGTIIRMYPNGSRINNRLAYNVDVLIYIGSLGQTILVTENIGLSAFKYPLDSYLICKYYNGDINIKGLADINEMPIDVKERLDMAKNQMTAQNINMI